MACAALLASPAAAQDDPLEIELLLGLESDSNATRVEGNGATSDTLTRYFLRLASATSTGRGQRLDLKLRSGGKLYQRFSEENALINQGDVRYTFLPLVGLDQRWLFVHTSGSLKDRTEEGRRRDYLRAEARGGAGVALGPVTLTFGGGQSLFVFKPDRALSNQGPLLDASVQLTLGDAWGLHLSLQRRLRRYDSPRFVELGPGLAERDDLRLRRDEALIVGGGVSYRGPLIVSLDLSWFDNRSNSYGQSLTRTSARLTATAPLPWRFLISASAELQQTSYADLLLVDPTLAVDEDNRNALVLELERPLGGPVGGVVRYALYSQAFGADEVDYGRQLVFLGLSLEH